MIQDKLTASDCLLRLQAKQAELTQQGQARLPRRGDFSEREVVAIKAFFGPWPRALEAAGLKPARPEDRLTQNREKRIRAKRRQIEAKKEAKGKR